MKFCKQFDCETESLHSDFCSNECRIIQDQKTKEISLMSAQSLANHKPFTLSAEENRAAAEKLSQVFVERVRKAYGM